MNYTQRNPLPVPDVGPFERVAVTMETVFDWEYALRRQNLLNLYEKGKNKQWNSRERIDWRCRSGSTPMSSA